MLWHCDTLTTGPASPKFKVLSRAANFDRIPDDYVFELAVLLATPGVREIDVRNWFRRKVSKEKLRWVAGLRLDVEGWARENAASVVELDAWAMLRLTPVRSTPGVWGRALILKHGFGPVAARIGVDEKVVRTWSARTAAVVVGGS